MAELNGIGYVAEMVAGEKSQFDVVVDSTETAFSKQREGHFPSLTEILARLPAAS